MNKLWYLSQISLLESLPEEDLLEIEKLAPHSVLKKGEIIQTPETFREGLYLLKKGKLKLYKINPEGKQFIVSVLGAGNVFGELDTFSMGTKDTFIETMEDTFLCSISKERFEHFLLERPQLAVKVLKELSGLLNERDAMMAQLVLGTVREKVLQLLLILSKKFGVQDGDFIKIDMPLSHQEIGDMIGSTRATVTLVLNDLVKELAIKMSRMTIEVNVSEVEKLLQMQ